MSWGVCAYRVMCMHIGVYAYGVCVHMDVYAYGRVCIGCMCNGGWVYA